MRKILTSLVLVTTIMTTSFCMTGCGGEETLEDRVEKIESLINDKNTNFDEYSYAYYGDFLGSYHIDEDKAVRNGENTDDKNYYAKYYNLMYDSIANAYGDDWKCELKVISTEEATQSDIDTIKETFTNYKNQLFIVGLDEDTQKEWYDKFDTLEVTDATVVTVEVRYSKDQDSLPHKSTFVAYKLDGSWVVPFNSMDNLQSRMYKFWRENTNLFHGE